MRSVVDITFGNPHRKGEGIMIPAGLNISDDEYDDNDLPIVEFVNIAFFIPDEVLATSREKVEKMLMDSIREHRSNWSSAAWSKIESALNSYLHKHDLTKLANGWFRDPESRTRH